jgi:hypothetical protein
MIRNLIAAGVAVFVAFPQTSSANGTERRTNWGVGIGPRYTYVMIQDSDETLHMGGAFLRARSAFVGIEGSIDYHEEELPFDAELRSWPVRASLLVYPLAPVYALAGLGWYNATLDYPGGFPLDDETDSQLGYHFGAGFEIPIANDISFTSDIRWLFIDYDFDEIPESVGEVDADAITVNAGLAIGLP